MNNFLKLFSVFAVSLTIATGCTKDSLKWGTDKWESVNGYDATLAAGGNDSQGTIVFGHQVDTDRCHYAFIVGREHEVHITDTKQLINLGIATKEFASFTIATLPAGEYFIRSIECVQSYRIGGAGGRLAKFEVKPGTISNLSVLAVSRRGKKGLFDSSVPIDKSVRPFTSSEIERIKEKYPEVVSGMKNFPMSVNF